MTRYILTGATGHLGNNVAKLLVKQGHNVVALVMPNDNTDMLPPQVTIMTGNTCDIQSLEQLFDDNSDNIVIHMAAVVDILNKDKDKIYSVNISGTKNVVQMCIQHNARLVYVSSVHAIHCTKNVVVSDCKSFSDKKLKGLYAKSKAIATQYVIDTIASGKLHGNVLMPSGIIGIGDYQHNHIMGMFEAVLRGKLPAGVVGSYDWVDVLDVSKAIYNATKLESSGQCYILCGHNSTIKELLDMVCLSARIKPIRTMLPLWFARSVAPLCECYYRAKKTTPLFTKYSLHVLDSGDTFDHSKATKALNYNPRPLQDTISDTVKWLIVNRDITIPQRIKLTTKARKKLPSKPL